MLVPAFKFSLDISVKPGLLVGGQFRGKSHCIAGVTAVGKVFIFDPFPAEDDERLSYLNVNRVVTSITAGALDTKRSRDLLFVGSSTNVLAYDVLENRDVFFREVPDGAHRLLYGSLGKRPPLLFVGGNCSVQALDETAQERYWTVISDDVSALTFCDIEEDGEKELVVASVDRDIRVFKGDDVLVEHREGAAVTHLTPIHHNHYGYALANGTCGVFEGAKRLWRAKSQARVSALQSFDLDGDGVPELIVGWDDGRLEVRSDATGEIIFVDTFDTGIAGIIRANFRNLEHEEVVVIAEDGTARGYVSAEATGKAGESVSSAAYVSAMDELLERRRELEVQFREVEGNLKRAKEWQKETDLVAATTQLDIQLRANVEAKCVDLTVQTSNNAAIHALILSSEQMFENEHVLCHPGSPVSSIKTSLSPQRDVEALLNIRAITAYGGNANLHVHHQKRRLPRFLLYVPVAKEVAKTALPRSKCVVETGEAPARVLQWLASSFALSNAAELKKQGTLEVYFASLRTGKVLVLQSVPGREGCMEFCCDDLRVVGDMIQDFAQYFNISDLNSTVECPYEVKKLQQAMARVTEFNQTRQNMLADVADHSAVLKGSLVQAEDARIVGDVEKMGTSYRELEKVCQDVLAEHEKRRSNYNALLEALRDVNEVIQRSANLRTGKIKAAVTAACRAAIKEKNLSKAVGVMQSGAEA